MAAVTRIEIKVTYADGTERLLDRSFAPGVPTLGSICLSKLDANGTSLPDPAARSWLNRPRQAPTKNATIADDVLIVHDEECIWY